MNFEFYPSSLCNSGGGGDDGEPTYVTIMRLFSFFLAFWKQLVHHMVGERTQNMPSCE